MPACSFAGYTGHRTWEDCTAPATHVYFYFSFPRGARHYRCRRHAAKGHQFPLVMTVEEVEGHG